MMLPRLNLRRTYLIARRDFLGYIKTWGFWISFLMPFLIFTLAFVGGRMDINVDPVRYETILDETGEYGEAIKAFDLAEQREKPWRDLEKIFAAGGMAPDKIAELKEIYKTQGIEEISAMIPTLDPSKFQGESARNFYVDAPSNDIEMLKGYLTGKTPIFVGGAEVKLGSLLHIYENEQELY